MSTRAYLDHASTSPLRPIAREAMLPFLTGLTADPSRLHAEALVSRAAIEAAREAVAASVGARPREVVFTSGGTEACNAAVYGARQRSGPTQARPVVVGAVEHSAVLDAVAREPRSALDRVTTVGVDGLGRYDAAAFAAAVDASTTLVCVQLVNHEVGTLQPVADVVTAVRERSDALVFVDACAAYGHAAVDFAALGADLLAISAAKAGGPAGAGALIVRRGLRIAPFVVGGAQERARRGGLENVAAIAGFGATAAEVQAQGEAEAATQRRLRDALAAVATAEPGVVRLGDPDHDAPHLLALGLAGVEAEPVLLGLDQRGVAAHSGSSCSSEALEPSPVLAAMGVDADRSLRLSVGWSSTPADVERFEAAFGPVLAGLRRLRTDPAG